MAESNEEEMEAMSCLFCIFLQISQVSRRAPGNVACDLMLHPIDTLSHM
jgi:hypothetical protein